MNKRRRTFPGNFRTGNSVVRILFFCGLSLLICAPYWIITFIRFPANTSEIGVLFGSGEIQYIPPVVSLAGGELAPTFSDLFSGNGVMVMPLLIIALYSIPFALFGAWAFVMVEVLSTLFALAAAYAFLGRFKLSRWLALLGIVLFFFSRTLAILLPSGSPWEELSSLLGIFQIYGKRFPRPALSLPLLLFFFVVMFDLWRAPRDRSGSLKFAALLGASASLLLQANPFDFLGIWLAPIAVFLLRVGRLRGLWQIASFAAIALATFVLVSAPMLVQLANVSTDLRDRQGFYAVADLADRLRLVGHIFKMQTGMLMVFAVVLPLLLAALARSERSRLLYLTLISTTAIVSPIVYSLGAPTLVQIYHFSETGRQIAAIVLVISMLIVLKWALRFAVFRFGAAAAARKTAWLAMACLLFLCGVASIKSSAALVVSGGPRPDLFPYAARKILKSDWSELTEVLAAERAGTPSSASKPLLLTNDTMTLYWWTLRRMGNVLMPDVVTVVLEADQIEYQLVQVGKLLGWTANEWIDFFSSPVKEENQGRLMNGNNIWFLGGNKYQASSIHAHSALDDYPAEHRQQIKDGKSEWQTVLPLSERRRLVDLYESSLKDPRSMPDFVVWAKRGEEGIRAEPKGPYRKRLENANYVLWEKH